MHKQWSRWFGVNVTLRYMMAFYVAAVFASQSLFAQTATNAVDDIVANVTYAKAEILPLALTALGLFIGIGAAVKYWKKVFGKG